MRQSGRVPKNHKSQNPNNKQITNDQNSKPVYDLEERAFQYWKNQNDQNLSFQVCFGHLRLEFEICL